MRAFWGCTFLAAITVFIACTHDFDKYDFEPSGGAGPGPGPGPGPGGGIVGGMGGMGGGQGGTGNAGGCDFASQCPGTDADCQQRTCINNMCGLLNVSAGSPCDDNGGSFCNGAGDCVQCTLPEHCPSNVCQNGDCICVLDADCAGIPDTWCDNGTCSPLGVDGAACAGDNECVSGFCPIDDGVCCDTACGSVCESCLMADTGLAADGICGAVTAGTDPLGECTAVDATCTGDNCGGVAGQCEPAAGGTVCRMAADLCDAVESCDGTNVGCPGDLKLSAGTPCRVAADLCDVEEQCDGTNDACPADLIAIAGTPCRPAGGTCDLEEQCDGNVITCPTDLKVTAGTICNPSAGPCDVPEQCNGTNDACPNDLFLPDGIPSLGGACDPYLCDGTMAGCPASCGNLADCVSTKADGCNGVCQCGVSPGCSSAQTCVAGICQ